MLKNQALLANHLVNPGRGNNYSQGINKKHLVEFKELKVKRSPNPRCYDKEQIEGDSDDFLCHDFK